MRELQAHAARYGEHEAEQPNELRSTLFPDPRPGVFGLLRDLQNLVVMATENAVTLTSALKAVHALRDEALLALCCHLEDQTKRQQAWLLAQVERPSARTLVVPQ